MIVVVKGKADYLWRVWYRHQELYIAHFVIEFELALLFLTLSSHPLNTKFLMFRGTGMPVCCCISDLVTMLFPSSDMMLYVSFILLSRILATFIVHLPVRHYCNLITVDSTKPKSHELDPCVRLKAGCKRFCKTLRNFKAVNIVLLLTHVEFLGNHDLVVNYITLCNPLYFRH